LDAPASPTVTLRVPPLADHLALLRTVVSGIAARQDYTLEQVDDLRMAVEEAAVQLLRHGNGSPLVLHATIAEHELAFELSTSTAANETVFDPSSFSWMILQALTDRLSTSVAGDTATLQLVKLRRPDGQLDEANRPKGQG
jgi:serine/threonine-protein kinase RsbW